MGQTKINKSWYLIVVEDMTDEKYDVIGDNSCPEISHGNARVSVSESKVSRCSR